MDRSTTDVSIVLKRLRDGAPCSESQGEPCKWRGAAGGCDCTIAADEIDRLTAEISSLRAVLQLIDDYYQTGGELMSHVSHIAQDALAGTEVVAVKDAEIGRLRVAQLTPDEANRLRQWYNALDDVMPEFLMPDDRALALKILGIYEQNVGESK